MHIEERKWIVLPDAATLKIIAQALGFMGAAIVVVGMQQKKYKHIVMCKIANQFLGGIHYVLLGGYTGMMTNLASCVTNLIYYFRVKKGKSTLVFQIIFAMMFVVLGALSWHGPISMFVIVAKVVSSVAIGNKNPRVIRILNLISGPCWLIYNIYIGSIAGIVSDSLMTGSVLIAIIRLDIFPKKENVSLQKTAE